MMKILKFMLFVCCEMYSDLCLEYFRSTLFKVESGCDHMFRVEYLEGSQPGFTSPFIVESERGQGFGTCSGVD